MVLPARIGKYELQEFLGGGMSHVYRAQDTIIGRTVALKILTEAGYRDPDVKARFLAEARMAGNVAHDNVLTIYDFGEDDQHRPFMVMEFLRGEDLRRAIENGHTGDLASKVRIGLQIARALEYIHTLKIIHRDIKPENIHVNTAGVVKLMDFGIAKEQDHNLTRAGYVLGTPAYMAPEQLTGQGLSEQVDVYAFGLVLFEVLTGTKAIAGDTMETLFYRILKEPIDLEPLKRSGAPAPVCDLVARCTAKDPAARPRGFGPVVAELERMTVVAGRAPEAVRRNWLPAAAIALVLLFTAVFAYFALRRTPETANLPKTLSTPAGEMVLVPAGEFAFGAGKDHVTLPAFYIDKTEVTNASYEQFCKATNRRLPEHFAKDKPLYPVVNVTILDARDFANWAKKRLPNSREWEKAARGVDARLYPWGAQPENSRANVATDGLQPASGFPNGASPYGALQMVGNAWEFVEQLSTPGPKALDYFKRMLKPAPAASEPWYIIRGQSFRERLLSPNVIWDSSTVPARWKDLNIGFRCVKDPA